MELPRHRPKVHPSTLKRVRLAVYTRDSFTCKGCGWRPEIPDGYDGHGALVGPDHSLRGKRAKRTRRPSTRILELDHVLPYSKGGKFTIENIQALCDYCNAVKGATV